MRICPWEELPDFMRTDAVRPYYEILIRKRWQLRCKRLFDVAGGVSLLVILSPIMLLLSVWIKLDSRGGVLYRQKRVTQYGREFRIYKFRTMEEGADKKGSLVTSHGDSRITGAGRKLRKSRLDELPQLFNIVKGEMSFVGTRPEILKFVRGYTEEMYATLLLPAGVTSQASIEFKDEEELLEGASDVEEAYLEKVLPQKMRYNLKAIKEFSCGKDLAVLFMTLGAVSRKCKE